MKLININWNGTLPFTRIITSLTSTICIIIDVLLIILWTIETNVTFFTDTISITLKKVTELQVIAINFFGYNYNVIEQLWFYGQKLRKSLKVSESPGGSAVLKQGKLKYL